jgi:hypothetical protein
MDIGLLVIQNNTRGAKNAYKQPQTKDMSFSEKSQGSSRKGLQSRLSDIGRIQDSRKFA